MKLGEIKEAISNGESVIWQSPSYEVIKDKNDEYLIKSTVTNHCIGLTWADGVTLNAKEEDFILLSDFKANQ